MCKQKIIYKKITALLIFSLFIQNAYGIDLKSIYIGAEVNGHCIYDKILLKDKDNCSLFIYDKDKNKVSLPANYTKEWYICFIKNNGNYGEDKILSSGTDGNCNFIVKPPFMGLEFEEGHYSQTYLKYMYIQKGLVTCKITDNTTRRTHNIYIPVEMDILPHINEFKVRDIYYQEEPQGPYPVVVFDVDISDFNCVALHVCDKDRGPYLYIYTDAPLTIPNTLICDNTYEDDFYILRAFNDYGAASVGPVNADWGAVGIKNSTRVTDSPNVTVNGNTCTIKGERPFKSIKIADINGRTFLYENNIQEVCHSLNKGIYIVHIITRDNRKYAKKILINK